MATIKGSTIAWGIGGASSGLITQRVSVTKRCEIKEARDKQGEVVAAAFYRNSTEVSVEGLTAGTSALLGTLALPTGAPTVTGALVIEEKTVELSNEDWTKTTLKAVAYATIV